MRKRNQATRMVAGAVAVFVMTSCMAATHQHDEPTARVTMPTVEHVDEHLPEVWPSCTAAMRNPTDATCTAYDEMMHDSGLVRTPHGEYVHR